ncbi:SUKH-3 domain-containing protein [Elizabethkingia sp. HX QKY]|uniref:SUKH-3 domain-containing protein n=1 Tax=Elizabethkingia TaxID=308865 RepID=UPI002A23DD85|nr:SUKH-3 domain-containing protein [Elizabethkingia sp. HX QKY]MDX8572670.1 SUKH-3 domain-containing protein [Elizabethkingia sp. HX QKY]
MKFSDKAKQLLKKAGWYEGRYISLEDLKLPYKDYPHNIIVFLQEYGNLEGDCESQNYTSVINRFFLVPETDFELLEGDTYIPYYSSIIGKKLFPIGAIDSGNGYDICCDFDGRVYKIGEYCFYVGGDLYEGIENILLMNTLKSLQLDEDTGKWWNMDGEYVKLP